MKPKKLLKRIIDSRNSKKAAKKVRKRNARFIRNLYDLDSQYDVAEVSTPEAQGRAVLFYDDLKTKSDIIDYVRTLLKTSDFDINENILNAKPVKSFEFGVFTFTFYDGENPYRVLTSPSVNLNAIKNIMVTTKPPVQPVDDVEYDNEDDD